MGKRIISQRRGRGTPTYKSPGHRFRAAVRHISFNKSDLKGRVVDIVNCPGHSSPLAKVQYNDGQSSYIIAPEGISVDQEISVGATAPKLGNCMPLKNIPEGTLIYNIENQPGDGGKFVRSTGLSARIVAKYNNRIAVMLPSKKEKMFHPDCRANIGTIAGSGRTEKPLVKAGRRYHKMKAKNKLYPKVSGTSMNAVDHPYGTSRSSKKGRPTTARKHAPPGANVGKIKARRTGKKR